MDAAVIAAMYAGGEKQKDIAAKYGVSQVCISQILLKKRHVYHATS
jgi:DNA-directed RNA polymerase specialized sigma subunit